MTRVLVVDDSAVFRKVIGRILANEPGVEVVGYAADPYEARERIAELRPDVITLDVEMPRMDGLAFLERLMRSHPMPVVLVSSLGETGSDVALRALALGAVDVVAKPAADASGEESSARLRAAVRGASTAKVRAHHTLPPAGAARRTEFPGGTSSLPPAMLTGADHLVAIGASTGGTRAIETILRSLPAAMPPIVVVIHMPTGFTSAFARRLSDVSPFDVHEASDREALEPGTVLVAPAGRHARLVRAGERFMMRLYDGPPVRHHRPNIDVFLHSVAEQAGPRAVGALLTGMGADGARGLFEMRQQGAFTVAEAEESCVVYGMPKAAAEMGAAERVAALPLVAKVICDGLRRRASQPASTPAR